MKPTKNQYFCADCRRTKMLFETEGEAKRFLEYNADEIEEETGKRPIRCYYCDSCSGWHITSKEEDPYAEVRKLSREQRVRDEKDSQQIRVRQERQKVSAQRKNIKDEVKQIEEIYADFLSKKDTMPHDEMVTFAKTLLDYMVDYRERKNIEKGKRRFFHETIESLKRIR